MNTQTFEWYEVSVEFVQEVEGRNGILKERIHKENYLVNAMSPTEAETRFAKHAEKMKFNDFRVVKAVEKKYIGVIQYEQD